MLLVLAGVGALVWHFMATGAAGPRSERNSGAGSQAGCSTSEGAPNGKKAKGGGGGAGAQPLGRLLGLVMDEDGDPIVGAVVELFDDPATDAGALRTTLTASDQSATTDRNGRFAFDCRGDVRLRVTGLGYAPAYEVLEPGEHEIELVAGRECTLIAVDPKGGPIRWATALVYSHPHDGWPQDVVPADASGQLRLRIDDFARVLLRAPGFKTLMVSDPTHGRRITMEPGVKLRGMVVDESGYAVEGVVVKLSLGPLPNERYTTGDDGAFSFGGLGPRARTLTVPGSDAFLPHKSDVQPGDDAIRIVLRRAVRQAGVVVFPDSTPAAGAAVRIAPASPVFADAQGRFEVTGLKPGATTVEATHGAMKALPGERSPPPAHRARAKISVPAEPLRLELVARPRSFVTWLFVDESGTPLAGVRVTGARTQSDKKGRATSAFAVSDGTKVEAFVIHKGWHHRFDVTAIAALDTEPRRITVRKLREITVIVRAPGGRPLPPGAKARVQAAAARSRQSGPDQATIAIDPDATHVTLTATSADFAPRTGRFAIPESGAVVVELVAGAVLRGKIVDAGGAPVAGAVLAIFGHSARLLTNPEGTFEIRGVAPGDIVLRVWDRKSTHGTYRQAMAKDGDVLDLGTLALGPPRDVAGRVTDSNGVPLPSVSVSAGAITDQHGRYKLRVSAAFLDRPVSFAKPGYATISRALENLDNVRLQRAGHVRVRVTGARGRREFFARRVGSSTTWTPLRPRNPRGRVVVLRDHAPGDFEIRLVTTSGEAAVTVRVVAGTTVETTLRLP